MTELPSSDSDTPTCAMLVDCVAPCQCFAPGVLVGAGFPRLTIKDSSFLADDLDAGVGDGRFKGYALNTEVGVTVYPHPQVGIVLGYGYRPIWFDHATGISDTRYELRPRFRESSKGVVFTTLFTF